MLGKVIVRLLGAFLMMGLLAGNVMAASNYEEFLDGSTPHSREGLPSASLELKETPVVEGETKVHENEPTASLAVPQEQQAQEQQTQGQQAQEQQAQEQQTQGQQDLEKKIVINLASRLLTLYQGNEKIRMYPIGPGTTSTPTPTGYYKISSKDFNPTWTDPSDPENVIPSGPSNPLGYRWMLLYGNYGIHGTNKPDSIGHYVSNGCIRMLESDVEALFDLVELGTPVEITYNRIVVEKSPDDMVAYYIYPDGYGWQPISVELVDQWLKGYGVESFVSYASIEEKISASDGEPTYIGKVYPILVNGSRISGKAVLSDAVMYLPVTGIASALQLDVRWNEEESSLESPYGKVIGYNKRDVLYFNADDVETLFHLSGGLNSGNMYQLSTTNKTNPFLPNKGNGVSPKQDAVDGTGRNKAATAASATETNMPQPQNTQGSVQAK